MKRMEAVNPYVLCEYCGRVVNRKSLAKHYTTKVCSNARYEKGNYINDSDAYLGVLRTIKDAGKPPYVFIDHCEALGLVECEDPRGRESASDPATIGMPLNLPKIVEEAEMYLSLPD